MRLIRAIFAVLALAVLTSVPATAQSGNLDCPNFRYQEDAQKVYESHADDPQGADPYGLDEDGDGLACEGLPLRGPEIPADEQAPEASGEDEQDDVATKTFTLRLDGVVPEGEVFYVQYIPVRVNGQRDFLIFCGEDVEYLDPAAEPCRGGGATYSETLRAPAGTRIEFVYVRATEVATWVRERFHGGTETISADATNSAYYNFAGSDGGGHVPAMPDTGAGGLAGAVGVPVGLLAAAGVCLDFCQR